MLNSVQILRAAAALGVVFFHLSIFFEQNLPSGFPRFETGVAGVDLFFVISGFIMVYTTPPDETSVGFMARRIARIVPLYWLVTLIFLALGLKWAWTIGGSDLSMTSLGASLLFIPHVNFKGELYPILTDGWTLNHEMLFYLLFSISLLLPLKLRLPAVLTMVTLGWALCAMFPGSEFTQFHADPIVLEFVIGCVIAWLVRTKPVAAFARKAPMWPLLLLAVTGFAASVLLPRGLHTIAYYGAPSALIVFAAACQDIYRTPARNSFFVKLGDASYSLYLLHRLVITIAGVAALNLFGHTGFGAAATTVVVLVTVVVAALLSLKYFERPLGRRLRDLLTGRRRTGVSSASQG